MTSPAHPDAHAHPRQPLLGDAIVALRAPTQVWSGRSGDLGAAPIDGVFHGDVRHVRALTADCATSPVEWISVAPHGASRVVFGGLLRGVDDPLPDPKVRLVRDRRVGDGRVDETWTVLSRRDVAIDLDLALRIEPGFSSLHAVKAGAHEARATRVTVTDAAATAAAGDQSFRLDAPGATVSGDADAITAVWSLRVEPAGRTAVSFSIELHDDTLVVAGAGGTWPPRERPRAIEPRLERWLDTALADLDALRLTTAQAPGEEFFAAGAPWFFTLFGRDSLWAARLALPLDAGIAASTLRVLAALQGTREDPDTAEEPGKIPHELRASALEIPSEGVVLPPLYYGSVDSTPLWVCLLADAWRAGMPDDEVRALIPALRGALGWILEHGDSDGDGFLDYVDRSGRGLANQGWKDSGDSIQWRDGRLAAGPIALCEVQGYAYEAALGAAELLEAFGDDRDDPAGLRAWAAALRTRFAAAFWVRTPEGRYPAVALDRDKRPVDTLTSNIGHLLGTGILDPDDETAVADLLVGATMSSGFGIRTMSTGAAGYWPLSYHGGSVWIHDTAIVARGMRLAGLDAAARTVVDGLLAAADGFGYRVPELHAGDAREMTPAPTPYPAACRPQAWSAAAAAECLSILGTV